MKSRVIVNVILPLVLISSVNCTEINNTVPEEDSSWRSLYKVFVNCSGQSDTILCLKLKAVSFVDRALAVKTPLHITEFLSLTVDHSAEEEEPEEKPTDVPLFQSESYLENILPKDPEERNEELDKLLQERVDRFLDSRSLQFTFPRDMLEGRKKKEKIGGALIAGGLAVAGMVAQLLLGKVAIIAGKALLIAKTALVLSAVNAAKKIFGGSEHSSDSHGWQHRSYLFPTEESSKNSAYDTYPNRFRDNEVNYN